MESKCNDKALHLHNTSMKIIWKSDEVKKNSNQYQKKAEQHLYYINTHRIIVAGKIKTKRCN